ncbi:hypothetical protein JCM10908_005923 [Rhodotorula pacifica]|uniref:RlpA-like double-psi beta-barrel domain-containing protein n=1 Tax=Rhodotorula pacifica TaxID=1495444 RepID=UPI0031748088
MLSQSLALPLALAASLASSAAAFKAPVLHDHHGVNLAVRHDHRHHGKEHARAARGYAAAVERRQQGRMQRKVRRAEGAMLLTVADNSTESSSSASSSSSSGQTYTSTAIWWLQDGWKGACGTAISADALQVALPLSLYPDASVKSSLCGTSVTVTAPSSGKSIEAVVVGASERNDYTSFTQAAFTALEGDLEAGELAISFTLEGGAAPAKAALVASTSSKEAPATTTSATTTTTTVAAAPKTTTAAPTTTQASTSQSTAAATTSTKDAALNLAAQKATTTTTSAPAATSSAAADESGDDWVCDEEDSSSSSSSSSSWVATSTGSRETWADRQKQTQVAAAVAPSTTTSEWVAPSSSTEAASSSTWTSSAPAQTSSASSSSSNAASSNDGVADTSGSLSLLSKAGIQGFLGLNSNSIISWYHTDSSTDSTNGNSWCGFPCPSNLIASTLYEAANADLCEIPFETDNDAVPGFAPSLKTMLNNFGGNYEAAATAYCGLEAVVTTPDGKSATLYIADAFDDTWVRTPASIDVIYDSFAQLYGSTTSNKNDVVQGATWRFTGNRNDKYKFKSTNSLS